MDSETDSSCDFNKPLEEDFTKSRTRKILIIQGDWEAGMSLLALDLKDAGHEVGKVLLCASDLIYRVRGIQTHLFRKPLADFDEWLRELVQKENYDTVFLYNHYRPYNQVAWKMAEEMNLCCYVFELGLIRPNCVTVFSQKHLPLLDLAKNWEKLIAGGSPPKASEKPLELCRVSTPAKIFVFGSNFMFSRITSFLFPNFVDQRDMKLWYHFKHGVIHLWRFMERSRDRELDKVFAGEFSGKYYAVALQVHSDTQIINNSHFTSIEEFIMEVVSSFEQHAPADTKLVFKDHPMDRGYKDYTDLISGLDQRLGGGRIFYVDRVSLPKLLTHSRGLVNINSSVGISGLIHHIPVLAMGKAVYDLEGLTYMGDLDTFWRQATKPDPKKVKHFVNLLLQTSQSRGTLSQRCFDVPGRCKIQWVKPFEDEFFS